MSLSAQLANLLQTETTQNAQRRLYMCRASAPEDVRAAQRLRQRIFVEETGARLDLEESGIVSDRYDPYCQHLLVYDATNGAVVGCCRILTDLQAVRAGGFFSQTEFDLARILALPGRIMEVGHSCVHPDYPAVTVIALLWQGLVRYMAKNRFDYLMGCAGISLRRGTEEALALYRELSHAHLSPSEWRVYPKVPLPPVNLAGTKETAAISPLLKAYLRAGAKICGKPTWDPRFSVADLFMLLRADDIHSRHARHVGQGQTGAINIFA